VVLLESVRTVIIERSRTLQQAHMLLELTCPPPFCYQVKVALRLSKDDMVALAANPPLQKLFTDSPGEQVVWSSDKA
jgi:hypothetical protein